MRYVCRGELVDTYPATFPGTLVALCRTLLHKSHTLRYSDPPNAPRYARRLSDPVWKVIQHIYLDIRHTTDTKTTATPAAC